MPPSEIAMEAISNKNVDVMSTLVKTPEREKYFNYTTPYLYIDWVVIRSVDAPGINSLADFQKGMIAVVDGYATQRSLEKEYPDLKLLPQPTTLAALQSVIQGKADAAVLERNTASMMMHAYRMYTLEIDMHVFKNDRPLSFAGRNDWPELVEILNKGLATITLEDHKAIEQKWVAMPVQIGFTKAEVLRTTLYVITRCSSFL